MMASQKGRRKGSAESTRKKPAGKSHAGQGWVAVPDNPSWMVPRWKSGKYPAEINVLLTDENPVGGAIHNSTFYAAVTSQDAIELSPHLPRRADSLFLHPDTMQHCGLAICQPVVLRSPACKAIVVCKLWPVAALELDAIAMGPTAQVNFHGNTGGLVEICGLIHPSTVPTACELHLQPCFKLSFPLTDSFKNYFSQMYEGQYVCCGNCLAVQFYGERRDFKVTAVELADSVATSSRLGDSTSDMSLLHDLSALSLQATPSRTSQPPVTSSTPKEKEASLESSPNTSLHVEPESTLVDESETGDSVAATDDHSAVPLREVKVCKITARTKIVIEKQQSQSVRILQPSLTAIGGLKQQTRLLRELLLFPLENPKAAKARGLWFPHGVLLHGAPGVGKSLLAQTIAAEASHSILVSAIDILASTNDADHRLQEVFREARENSSCLLVLEDLHVLCPHRDSTPSENERKTSATLASLLDQLHSNPPPGHVVVIATTNQLEGVEASLRRPGRFDREIEIPVPNVRGRKEIFDILLLNTDHTLNEEEVLRLASAAHGHVGADLLAVCQEAHYKALQRVLEGGESWEGVKVCYGDMKAALCEVHPSAMREVTLEVPKVLWSDVGGEEDIKQRLRESVEWPLRHPEAFSRLGINPPKGVLLYGPPGCSKTMIARALATESGLNFIAVKGPELFSKWVGDSERAVRQVFSRARAAAPAIVFFDEIDALAVHRKSEGSSVGDRVLAQLLTEMDGVEYLGEVLVVAATNRPDLIDKALLRPGRIDRLIYVPLPSMVTRREILKLQFKRTPVAADVELEALVTKTEGFSGAEVVSLCQEAALSAMHEDIASPFVCQRHFRCALSSVRPQTDPAMLNLYENYCKSRGANVPHV